MDFEKFEKILFHMKHHVNLLALMEAKTDLLTEQTEASSVKTSTPMLSETKTISRNGRSVEKSQKYSLDAEWRSANK